MSASSPDSSALDAIHEGLQLLEAVRPAAQDEDRLRDDKAQALLWLYICTLEAKMQEVSVAVWVCLAENMTSLLQHWCPGSQVPVLLCSSDLPFQGIERDRRAQTPNNLEEFEVNDLSYEDKLQEVLFLYSNIACNLAADAGEGRRGVLGLWLPESRWGLSRMAEPGFGEWEGDGTQAGAWQKGPETSQKAASPPGGPC